MSDVNLPKSESIIPSHGIDLSNLMLSDWPPMRSSLTICCTHNSAILGKLDDKKRHLVALEITQFSQRSGVLCRTFSPFLISQSFRGSIASAPLKEKLLSVGGLVVIAHRYSLWFTQYLGGVLHCASAPVNKNSMGTPLNHAGR